MSVNSSKAHPGYIDVHFTLTVEDYAATLQHINRAIELAATNEYYQSNDHDTIHYVSKLQLHLLPDELQLTNL